MNRIIFLPLSQIICWNERGRVCFIARLIQFLKWKKYP
jgi:hypothetical protein